MQLFFTADELKLLVEVIEHRDRELRDEAASHPEQETGLPERRDSCMRLLDRIAMRDLGFAVDELEDMVEMLTGCRASIRRELAEATLPHQLKELEARSRLLDHILDKLTEASAMA